MTANTAQDSCAHSTDDVTVVLPYRWDPVLRLHIPATATKTYRFDASYGRWTKLSDYDEHSAVRLVQANCTGLT